MPTGKVKWFDSEKGFGFLTSDDGQEVFLHAQALPAGVQDVKAGTRMEFGIADGKKGPQALSARVLETQPSVVKATRKPAADMAVIVEDLIKLLESTANSLQKGKYPDRAGASKVASVLRAVASDLDGQ
ncbi:cold shock domain-containing protein [Acaricomes phytoseiuli]|uniref:cold-shock protein n=1 Tax=Acaricomes phytoseiuli TaxID=291968 RepID=UPI00037FBB87|nr:cold shock domain-containing protein [Acaricomes phytoseiuli]MCW1249499.1 cold shock domain-containing protein [Acaricomes phytoseiuli]